MTDEKYLTVEEVANELRISTDIVYKWLNTGELVGHRLARKVWRIGRDDLNQFMEKRKNTKPDIS
jgi:excisionase family DNA binding protein